MSLLHWPGVRGLGTEPWFGICIQIDMKYAYRQIKLLMDMCVHVESRHARISHFPVWIMRGPRSTITPGAKSTLSTQILISKYPLPINGTRIPWRSGRF